MGWMGVRLARVELVGSPDDASYDSLVVLVGAGQYVRPKASDGAHGVLADGAGAPHALPRATYVHGDRESEVAVAF